MKRFGMVICLLAAVAGIGAQRVVMLPAEGSNGITEAESTGSYGEIYNITQPRIDLYLPSGGGRPATTLLVCPGGAYQYVSVQNEGKYVADWALQHGMAVAVLKYRLPNGHDYIPLSDAMAAMRMLRDSADVWNLDAGRIGVMGFSAGGHLAGSLLTKYADSRTRPDFGVLVYPVLSMEADTHLKTRRLLLGDSFGERQKAEWTLRTGVGRQVPPCFVVACQDDKGVPVSNSIVFFTALTKAGVRAELLVMPKGGHGFGFMREIPQAALFHQLLLQWINEL